MSRAVDRIIQDEASIVYEKIIIKPLHGQAPTPNAQDI
jgi:hypothetical protein